MARRPADRNRPDDQRPPIFEFCVTGQPVSAQAKNRALLQRWKDVVSAAAFAAWPEDEKPLESDVELRVTQYSERRIADRDNLIKPIQDALQSIAYLDDKQVKDSASNWRNINGKFTVRFMSTPLAMAFSNGKDFLHIRLWLSAETEELG
jgi:Holliday junction resolvase RusA-like endonuclease